MNERDLDMQAQTDFEFTQNIRRKMVTTLTPNEQAPTNKEDQQVLLQTLRDMDSQNIQRLRVKVEEKTGGAIANLSSMVSSVLREINPNNFTIPSNSASTPVIALPNEVEKAVPVPGEMDIDPPQGDYNNFIKQMKG